MLLGCLIPVVAIGTGPCGDARLCAGGGGPWKLMCWSRMPMAVMSRFGITPNCIALGVIATGRIVQTVIPGEAAKATAIGPSWSLCGGSGRSRIVPGSRVPGDRPLRLRNRSRDPDRRRGSAPRKSETVPRLRRPGRSSLLTRGWREMDSNHRSLAVRLDAARPENVASVK
jgi:hypothetical protein